MLSKEESLKMAEHLDYLIPLKSEYGYGCSEDDFYVMKSFIYQLIEEHFNPKAYKFGDLKEGLWVWDRKENKCNKIIGINNGKIEFYYVIDNASRFTCEFEENRFFPVWRANVEVE